MTENSLFLKLRMWRKVQLKTWHGNVFKVVHVQRLQVVPLFHCAETVEISTFRRNGAGIKHAAYINKGRKGPKGKAIAPVFVFHGVS